jgi:outer membrane receptor for ferrienterochelin and colicin
VNEPISINNGYAVKIVAKRIQANLKTGMVFPESPWKSIGWQNSWTLHNQSSLVGLKSYEGNQQSYYSNLVYLDKIKTTDNQIKAGIDFKVDHFIESYNDSVFQTNEVVPGMYSEYTLKKEMKFGMVAGMRVDYHNLFGWLFTPRFNLKYNFTPELIVRFSGGRGYRTPHIYVDNTGLMASSKRLVVINTPKIEDGWNSGINFTYQFHLLHREASFTADLYRSWFNNQIVVDQYSQSDAVLFYNLNGSSTSNSFQAVMNYELLERLNLRIAYKTDDVKTDYIESPSTMKPLVPKNRALFSLSYLTKKEKWRFDSTLLWDGIKRLPNAANSQLQGHNHTEQNKEYSTDYFQWSAQITRSFKNWEIYIGAENILNYTQHEPILSSNDPFGPQFDATRVWGPLMDRKLYSGLRLTLK